MTVLKCSQVSKWKKDNIGLGIICESLHCICCTEYLVRCNCSGAGEVGIHACTMPTSAESSGVLQDYLHRLLAGMTLLFLQFTVVLS